MRESVGHALASFLVFYGRRMSFGLCVRASNCRHLLCVLGPGGSLRVLACAMHPAIFDALEENSGRALSWQRLQIPRIRSNQHVRWMLGYLSVHWVFLMSGSFPAISRSSRLLMKNKGIMIFCIFFAFRAYAHLSVR